MSSRCPHCGGEIKTPSEQVMTLLAGGQVYSPTELAKLTGVQKPSMTRILDKLVTSGKIVLMGHEKDKRRKYARRADLTTANGTFSILP